MRNKLFSACTVVMFGALGLIVAVHPAKALDCASRSDSSSAEAVCVDGAGNSVYLYADDQGNQVAVDSNGNYEVVVAY